MSRDELIDKSLKELLEFITGAADFVKEQAPDVAVEIINYSYHLHWIWLVACTLVAIISFLAFLFLCKNDDLAPAVSFVISALCTIGAVYNTTQLIKVEKAPKLYILDYVKRSARGGCS